MAASTRQGKLTYRESPHDVAERYGVHVNTIRRLIAIGELPHVRVGRQVRLNPDEVDAALRNRDA